MQLNIRIIEAKDIAKMDTFGKTDAYCQFGLNNKITYKTKIIDNCMTPKWNEEFSFPVSNPVSDSFHLIMKDHDIAMHDLIAVLDISLSSLPIGVVVDHWYPHQPVDKVPKGGLIHLLLHLAVTSAPPFITNPTVPIPNYPLKLHLRLIEAKEIPKMDFIGSTDAYCIMTISGGQKQRSTTQKNNMLPKWNQEFHFDIPNPNNDELQIVMRDEDIKNDDNISKWSMPIRYIPFCSLADQWVVMEAFPKVKKGGYLHILIHLCPANYSPFVAQPPPTQPQPQPQQQPQSQQQQIPQGYPPQGYAPQGYAPPQGYPPQGYPPQGYPPQGYPPQGYPPQGYPPQGYPPQGYTPPPPGYVPPTPGQPQGYPPK